MTLDTTTATVSDSLQRLLYFKIVTEGLTAEEATSEIMNEWDNAFSLVEDHGLVDQLFGLVRPLIADRAKRIYRNHTRALEDRVFSNKPLMVRRVNPLTGETTETSESVNWHEAQKQLLKRKFNLPDGRWVSYEESTPEDHDQRARWQQGRADSIIKDATRHLALADIMRQYEADRLGDLDVDLWKGLVDQ